jgi:hypothetical protein
MGVASWSCNEYSIPGGYPVGLHVPLSGSGHFIHVRFGLLAVEGVVSYAHWESGFPLR